MNETVLIVGAGSAGCTAAARLSADSDRQIILIESGPDSGEIGPLASLNWLDALAHRDAFYSDLMAVKSVDGAPRLYQRGKGVGGSASTNAMLALPGLPADYNNYVDRYSLSEWSWEKVSPWFDALKHTLTLSIPPELNPVDRATLRSGSELGIEDNVDSYTPQDGTALLYRTADRTGRKSSLELWLNPVRHRENLEIRANTEVDRVLFNNSRAIGVRLSDGTDLFGDQVILCAGVFESPCVLMRSGINLPGLGKGLQDHPAASIYFSMKPEHSKADRRIPCIGSVIRMSSSVGNGDLHLLPLHGQLMESEPPAHGLLMAALMRTRSVGSLRLNPDNPTGRPVVDLRMLSDPGDVIAMREAIDAAITVLNGSAYAEIVESIFIDDKGTPTSALDDNRYFEKWISQYLGDYFHAVGTARMGVDDDPLAVVDQLGRVHGLQGVHVWDASILPEVPSANTHLPVTMLAERLSSAYISGRLV